MLTLAVHLLTLTVTFLPATTTAFNCYWPNGEDRNAAYRSGSGYSDSPYQPTDPVNGGMCCAEWNIGAQPPFDSGLCVDSSNQLWRESCTDRSWQSKSCLNICATGVDPTGMPYNATDRQITSCGNGVYCCDANNTACCAQGDGFTVVDSAEQPLKGNGSTTSSGTANTTSNGGGMPSAELMPPPSHHGLTGGAIAGVVVGVVAVLVVALGLVMFLLRQRRRRRTEQEPMANGSFKEVTHEKPGELDSSNTLLENDAASVHELADPEFEAEQDRIKKEKAIEVGSGMEK